MGLHMPANYGVRLNILMVPFTLENYKHKQNHVAYRSVDSLILTVFQFNIFVLGLFLFPFLFVCEMVSWLFAWVAGIVA